MFDMFFYQLSVGPWRSNKLRSAHDVDMYRNHIGVLSELYHEEQDQGIDAVDQDGS